MSPVVIKAVRQKTVQRFPYHILYELRDPSVYVIAIMHQRRKPLYWQGRV